jgi:hypothetical protein
LNLRLFHSKLKLGMEGGIVPTNCAIVPTKRECYWDPVAIPFDLFLLGILVNLRVLSG